MRTYSSVPRVDAPSSDYPKGRMRDTDATIPVIGTPVTELIYGDIHQFFQKMVAVTEITENNLPDNESNGYQLIEAMMKFISGTKFTETYINQFGKSINADLGVTNAEIVFSKNGTTGLDEEYIFTLDDSCKEFYCNLTPVSDDGSNVSIIIKQGSDTLITVSSTGTTTEYHYIKKIGGEWFEFNGTPTTPYPVLIP